MNSFLQLVSENQWCCTSSRDLIKKAPLSDRVRKRGTGREKSPAPGGIWTHDLLIATRVLYHCATTASQFFFITLCTFLVYLPEKKYSNYVLPKWTGSQFCCKAKKRTGQSINSGPKVQSGWCPSDRSINCVFGFNARFCLGLSLLPIGTFFKTGVHFLETLTAFVAALSRNPFLSFFLALKKTERMICFFYIYIW